MKQIIISLAIALISITAASQASDWLKPYQNSRNDREEVNIKLPVFDGSSERSVVIQVHHKPRHVI